MKWLFDNKEKAQLRQQREASLKTALDSTTALESAAKGTMNLAQDVTVTLQAKIEDYAAQIDQTSKMLNDALILVDAVGTIESFNPAAEKMFGYKKRQVIGTTLAKIFDISDELHGSLKAMEKFVEQVNVDEGSSVNHHEDFMGLKSNGFKLFVDVTASKLVSSEKRISYIIIVKDVTHRVNNGIMIRDLAEKNQELLTTIDASNTGFLILEPQGVEHVVSFVNEGFCRITGIKRFNFTNMNLRDLLGVDAGYWVVRRTLMENIEGRHEVQLKVAGDDIWFDVHITPVKKSGIVTRWILVFYDTSELKRAYTDLRKSESHFRAFSEASSESMFIHNDGIVDWNERLLVLTGYDAAELGKIEPLDFIHPLERENVREKVQSETSESYETLFLTKQGSVKEVAINSRPIAWENAKAQIIVARDVTEFKDVETQLKTSRERYRTVIDNTIDMVICFNADLEITFSNQTFRDYFDVEVEDINGFSLLEIIPPEDHEKFQKYVLSMTPAKEIQRGIHRVKRHDEVRWQDWIDRAVFDAMGNLIEIQSVARDVTHLMPSQ